MEFGSKINANNEKKKNLNVKFVLCPPGGNSKCATISSIQIHFRGSKWPNQKHNDDDIESLTYFESSHHDEELLIRL